MRHHAYYIEGSPALFEEYKKSIPHFVAQKYERFGVDEARELSRMASLKNVSGEAVFLLAAGALTSEAEQALLKLFEEPQRGTVFVVLAPHGALGATLKSRMMEYEGGKQSPAQHDTEVGPSLNKGPTSVSQEANKFLKMSGKERSDFIAKLLKDEEGAKERVRDFVNALEAELAKNIKENAQSLADITMVRDYLGDRAPSLKMLLEHLAVALPVL